MTDGSQTETQEEQARNYIAEAFTFLGEQRDGLSLHEFAEAVSSVVAAVRQSGKGGAVTWTFTFRPVQKGGGSYVTISDDVRSRLPKIEKLETLMFAHEDGRLSRNDPRQPKLPGV